MRLGIQVEVYLQEMFFVVCVSKCVSGVGVSDTPNCESNSENNMATIGKSVSMFWRATKLS